MDGQEPKTAFITGAASGLGRELARQYLAAGWRVAVFDCDHAGLAAAWPDADARVLVLPGDVRSEHDLAGARDRVLTEWGRIDLLVNNAGVALAGALEACSADDWEWIVQINLLGVVRGCRLFLPAMRAQRAGHVVNVASMAGLLYPPGMAAYCATKAGVIALSEVLQAELDGSGIGVSVVCPAFFRTGLARTSRTATPELRRVIEHLVGDSTVPAARIAAAIRAGVSHRRFLITTHRRESLVWLCKRLLPQTWFFRLMMRALRATRPS
ncbi:MAG: SDR family NAD(P)-dependent oxidoreductase [Pseudomonadota bacterium]|nr:SDR family NAD(P)-dependent oxidoreductase [Pseudomonadota bacterium]